jgi:cold shock CspA family protein
MSSSGTTTSGISGSGTLSRTEFLGKIIKYVNKATVNSTSLGRIIEQGIVQNQWVEAIYLRGLTSEREICTEIVIRIDWDRHRIHIKEGKNEIEYNEQISPGANLSNKIDAIVEVFCDIISENGLQTDWAIDYCNDVNRELVRRDTGTTPVKLQWKQGTVTHIAGVNAKKADELFLDLSAVVNEEELGTADTFSGVIETYGSRGFGFIRLYKKHQGSDRVFFHISNVVNSEDVIIGRTVRFSLEADAKGLRAVNVQIVP